MNHPAAPAWTIQGKKQTIDLLNDGHVDSSPGPLYDTSSTGIKTRSVSFTQGKSRRTTINEGVNATPSPSVYDPHNPAFTHKQIAFTRGQRFSEPKEHENPQPSKYHPDQNYVKERIATFTLGQKYPSIMDATDNNPGPGQYQDPEQILSSKFKTKRSKFGSQKRFSQPNLHKAGVGDYNVSTTLLTQKGALPHGQRFKNSLQDFPAPDQYAITSQFMENTLKNVGKSIGQPLKGAFNDNSDTKDSFNNYFREGTGFNDGRKYSVGKQRRQIWKDEGIPAPTDYDPKVTQKNSSNAIFPKGRSVENKSMKDNPGPGQYQDKKFSSTMYSFSKSKSLSALNRNPGAGRYNTDRGMGKLDSKYLNQPAGTAFAKSNRTNFISKNIAGVGDYNILQKKAGGVSIPKAQRFAKANKNPGPGDYHFQSTISNFTFYRKR